MIADLLGTWSLFGHTYVGSLLLAALLSLTGMHLYARRQVFLGAALAQASTMGVSIALATAACHPFGLHLHDTAWYPRLWAIACAMIAAAGMEQVARRSESREGAVGAVFLITSAAALLITARQPFGMDEVQRMLASSLLVIGPLEIQLFGLLLLLAALVTWSACDRLLLVAVAPRTAAAAGLRVSAWQLGTALGSALVIGASIQSTGLLFTFANLLLPVLAAKRLVREMRTLFVVAPVLAVIGTGAGFLFSHAGDHPPAQVMVVVHTALILMAALASRIARLRQSSTSCPR